MTLHLTLQEAIEADERDGTYRPHKLRCGNCGWQDSSLDWGLPIPKGQTVAETPCPRCACLTLRRGLV